MMRSVAPSLAALRRRHLRVWSSSKSAITAYQLVKIDRIIFNLARRLILVSFCVDGFGEFSLCVRITRILLEDSCWVKTDRWKTKEGQAEATRHLRKENDGKKNLRPKLKK